MRLHRMLLTWCDVVSALQVMHIAARKGSSALLALLVKHGGAEGAWVADSLGETPVDIARKNRHQDFFRLVVAAA